MTINQKIINALKPLGIPVTSDFFGGGNSEYITFNYVKDGAELFADNQPVEDISLMQIHYFLPSTSTGYALPSMVAVWKFVVSPFVSAFSVGSLCWTLYSQITVKLTTPFFFLRL